MEARRRRWRSRITILWLAMVLMGCATGDQVMTELHSAKASPLGVELILGPSNQWNSTDQTLWMDSQGGG